jgi:hypothetical protein
VGKKGITVGMYWKSVAIAHLIVFLSFAASHFALIRLSDCVHFFKKVFFFEEVWNTEWVLNLVYLSAGDQRVMTGRCLISLGGCCDVREVRTTSILLL